MRLASQRRAARHWRPKSGDDEVESWKQKDPIARFEKYMMDRGALDQDGQENPVDGVLMWQGNIVLRTGEGRLGQRRAERKGRTDPYEQVGIMKGLNERLLVVFGADERRRTGGHA